MSGSTDITFSTTTTATVSADRLKRRAEKHQLKADAIASQYDRLEELHKSGKISAYVHQLRKSKLELAAKLRAGASGNSDRAEARRTRAEAYRSREATALAQKALTFSPTRNMHIAELTALTSPIVPHTFSYFGKKVSLLFRHQMTPEQKKMVSDAVVACYGHCCDACITRAAFFCTLSGIDRSHFDPAAVCMHESSVYDLAKMLSALADTVTQSTPCGIYFVKHGQTFLGDYLPQEGSCGEILFHHFAIPIVAGSTSDKEVKIEMIEKGLDTLLFQSTIFADLVARMKRQGRSSLDLFTSVCNTSTYGEKTFGHATRWMMKIVEGGSSSVENFIRHIFDAGLSYVGLMNVDCTLRHTADQILTILEDPLTKSFDGLSKLLAQRADPYAYRRTTVAPTEGQLKMAVDALAGFLAQIMTIEYAKTLPGYTSFESSGLGSIGSTGPVSGVTGSLIQDMLQKTQSLKLSQSTSFADRMKAKIGPEVMRQTIRSLATMEAFLAFMKEHPGATVVLKSGGHEGYHATCTFGKDADGKEKVGLADYMPGYIWGFGGCSLGYSYGNRLIKGVMHTKTSLHDNYVFISGPTKETFSVSSGCFFPEFLHSSITRTCGSTFEALKSKHASVVSIPDGPLMAGMGFSVADKASKLYMPAVLSIAIDGVSESCTLTHARPTA